jgi:ribosomal protein S18 acetylase RimI-like enzyme
MKDSFNIRLAVIEDLNNINSLFKEVIEDIHNVKKINMWNTEYPFSEFKKDINNSDMYVIEVNNKIIGSFTITDFDDPEYYVINWTTKDKRFCYLNRLVILPSLQGMGYAKKAMDFIDNYAINNGYEVIRLTVHRDNVIAIGLYKKYGFKKIENSEWVIGDKVFIGFEKIIKNL